MFCIFSSKSGDSSWNVWWVIVRTSKSWQTHRYTHTHTDTGDDNTRRPKGPRVKMIWPIVDWIGYKEGSQICIFLLVWHRSRKFVTAYRTGGHRTRVAAVTLDNMAEDAVDASASLWQILTVSVRYCGPAFVRWLSMLWDTLTRNPELQWLGISPLFRLKLLRDDEGVGHACFPGDEGVGRPWRGYRCVQMNVGPA